MSLTCIKRTRKRYGDNLMKVSRLYAPCIQVRVR